MDVKSDATHTHSEDAKRWCEADVAASEQRVRRLQAPIVQARERVVILSLLSPRWVVEHLRGLYPCLSRMR